MELYDDPEPTASPEKQHGRLYWFFWHIAEWFMQQPLPVTESDVPQLRIETLNEPD